MSDPPDLHATANRDTTKSAQRQATVSLAITREGLLDGSVLAAARAHAHPGIKILNDREIHTSREAAMRDCPDRSAVWVFGYGSLIWNPAMDYAESSRALLHGWHRRFCMTTSSRGTPDRPGLMLALDRGGSCWGVAFRIEQSKLELEMKLLWNREMIAGSYCAHWLPADAEHGPITVLAFTANHDHPRYTGHLDDTVVAERIAFARGHAGTVLGYFRNTHDSLKALALPDPAMDALARRVDARLNSAAETQGAQTLIR